MKRLANQFTLSAGALAAALMLSACGGADPLDKTAPTVAITDNVPDATATGPVTFTFTFSEEVKDLTAEDVTVSGGGDKAATVTKSSATVYTLVVTPTANASGTISVSIPASKFMDLANNPNAAVAAVEQVYNTAPVSGSTGTCTAEPCLSFSEATLAFAPFEGLASATVDSDPADATNKVAKLVKAAAGQPWAGTTVYTTSADKSVAQIDFSSSKIITLRVYSPAAGEKIMLKLEDAANPDVNLTAEALSTKANAWETLSFNYAAPTGGVYSGSATYNKISIFPGFMTQVDKTYYFDELKYTAKAAPSVTPLIFASGYTAVDAPAVGSAYQGVTTQGGAFNWTVADGATYGWGGADFWWSGIASADATPNFYWGGKGKADQAYMASWVNSPANTPIQLSGQSKLRITVWGNDELVGAPRFTPVIQLADTNGCYPRAEASPLTPTSPGADNATYNVALSSFSVVENCGSAITTSEFMAKPIGSVHIRIYKANYLNVGNAYGSPNGINLGPISFQP